MRNTHTRKIAEALYIKRDKPSLNVQTMSFLIRVTIITLIDRAFISLIILKQLRRAILC